MVNQPPDDSDGLQTIGFPPSLVSLEERRRKLFKVVVYLKRFLLQCDAPVEFYRALDDILQKGCDNEQTIETLLSSMRSLREDLYNSVQGNKRLQSVNNELQWRLSRYEDEEVEKPVNSKGQRLNEGGNRAREMLSGIDGQFGEFLTGPDAVSTSDSSEVKEMDSVMHSKIGGLSKYNNNLPIVSLPRQQNMTSISSPRLKFTVPDEIEHESTAKSLEIGDEERVPNNVEQDGSQQIVQTLRKRAQDVVAVLKAVQKGIEMLEVDESEKALTKSTRHAYNQLAAKIIFNRNNPQYYHFTDKDVSHNNESSDGPTKKLAEIDLHNLHAPEAQSFAKEHILLCRTQGVKVTEIICGRGNHSKDGASKLKPALLESLRKEAGVKVEVHNRNPGRLIVHLLEEDPQSVIRSTNANIETMDTDEMRTNVSRGNNPAQDDTSRMSSSV